MTQSQQETLHLMVIKLNRRFKIVTKIRVLFRQRHMRVS